MWNQIRLSEKSWIPARSILLNYVESIDKEKCSGFSWIKLTTAAVTAVPTQRGASFSKDAFHKEIFYNSTGHSILTHDC